MKNICKNCGTHFDGDFCSNCGQKAYKKIDKKYITDELQYTLIHTNKGFLYSLKKIIANPGKTAREYIEGNRVNHYKPLAMLFILSTISAFIMFKIVNTTKVMKAYHANASRSSLIMDDFYSFTVNYNSILMLLLVPLLAFCSWFVIKKWGQNYCEHVVINAYLMIIFTLVTSFLLAPILYFVQDNTQLFMNIMQMSFYVLLPLLMFWFFKGFYPEKTTKEILLQVFIISIMFFVIYLTFVIIATIIYVIFYGIINGADALILYTTPKK